MTISELIAALEAIRADHGDLPVSCLDPEYRPIDPRVRVSLEHDQVWI